MINFKIRFKKSLILIVKIEYDIGKKWGIKSANEKLDVLLNKLSVE